MRLVPKAPIYRGVVRVYALLAAIWTIVFLVKCVGDGVNLADLNSYDPSTKERAWDQVAGLTLVGYPLTLAAGWGAMLAMVETGRWIHRGFRGRVEALSDEPSRSGMVVRTTYATPAGVSSQSGSDGGNLETAKQGGGEAGEASHVTAAKQPEPKLYSRLALMAAFFGLVAFFFNPAAIPAIVLGVLGILRLALTNTPLGGRGLCFFAIVMGGIAIAVAMHH